MSKHFADPNTKPALSQKLCSLVVGFFYIKVSLNYASVSPVVLIAMLVRIRFKLDNTLLVANLSKILGVLSSPLLIALPLLESRCKSTIKGKQT